MGSLNLGKENSGRFQLGSSARFKHGLRYHYLYPTWLNMKSRCLNPKHKHYHNYGGRGITICDRWKDSFVDFLKDVGERPTGKTLDRIDNSKSYSPDNCQWATRSVQNRNSRRVVTSEDMRQSIKNLSGSKTKRAIARLFGISEHTVRRVITGESWT